MLKKVGIKNLSKFKEYNGHETVFKIEDRKTGLNGFISIHSTRLGPATGGTRYKEYINKDDALRDALNLSRAMTYKCALAEVKYGGGKAVIVADPKKPKTPELLRAYAKEINKLEGKYSTGEDVGINENDVEIMAEVSSYINGLPGKAGDPSPFASLSVFNSIVAAMHEYFGDGDFRDRVFLIKGVGKVGGELCRLIYERGGKIVVADVDQKRVNELKKAYPKIKISSPDKIHKIKADVYCPCALGGEFNEETVSELKCKIICGAANNQLCSDLMGDILFGRGIVYVPDYIANSGGLINVVEGMKKDGYKKSRSVKKISKVANTVKKVLRLSKKYKISTNKVADELVNKVIYKK